MPAASQATAVVSKIPVMPENYRPSETEDYMNPLQLLYFKRKLEAMRTQVVQEAESAEHIARSASREVGDDADFAASELENSMSLHTSSRYRNLVSSIDAALRRIASGSYGYCEETDEEIGLKRLEARPTARFCMDVQERREHRGRQMAA